MSVLSLLSVSHLKLTKLSILTCYFLHDTLGILGTLPSTVPTVSTMPCHFFYFFPFINRFVARILRCPDILILIEHLNTLSFIFCLEDQELRSRITYLKLLAHLSTLYCFFHLFISYSLVILVFARTNSGLWSRIPS